VRKTRQLDASSVKLSGKGWQKTFDEILTEIREGLGLDRSAPAMRAELYKLLIYETGGFFAAHRDTEKVPGMFGTLVVALPSHHRGGELLVRHGGREIRCELGTDEPSEIRYAAFFADCEHEVLPVTEGCRICLVYNLIQAPPGKGKARPPLKAPDFRKEAEQAADLLGQELASPRGPRKLAWLLEHQYTQAELAFDTLKGADRGIASVLAEAADRTDCELHLGIVHIEESGSAEISYEDYGCRRRRWNPWDNDDDDESDEDAEFEVVDPCEYAAFINTWVAPDGRAIPFGPIPLDEGELLPTRALDKEKPDVQRVTEATGNEGASYERSYHRAALVLWSRGRVADVMAQAGAAAMLAHLGRQLETADPSPPEIRELASQTIESWHESNNMWWYWDEDQRAAKPDRSAMLACLAKIGNATLSNSFIRQIVVPDFDGSETKALVKLLPLFAPAEAKSRLNELARKNTSRRPHHVAALIAACLKPRSGAKTLRAAAEGCAEAMVAELRNLKAPPIPPLYPSSWSPKSFPGFDDDDEATDLLPGQSPDAPGSPHIDATSLATLVIALRKLNRDDLLEKTADTIAARPKAIAPTSVAVPALRKAGPGPGGADLWNTAARNLLKHCAKPPAPPRNWKIPAARLRCDCPDCQALKEFLENPELETRRFPLAKERRQHLHRLIEELGLDMTHVTERKGRPYTLVCTKTRRAWKRRQNQYKTDVAALKSLARLAPKMSPDPQLAEQVRSAITMSKNWKPKP